jgi:hypothetical protein
MIGFAPADLGGLTIRFLILAAILLVCTGVEAKSVSPHAQEVVGTIKELRAIGLANSETGQNGPPAKVPGLLRQLNEQLKRLITETLNDRSRPGVASEREIIAELEAAGWKEIPPYKWNAYGEISQIRFDAKPGYDPGILVASTQLWVPCGSTDPDTAIYVFQGSAREWKLVLATEADFDAADQRQQNGLQYELSPPDARGSWYLAVVQAPPACGPTPMPASLRYKIMRPGQSSDDPRIILERREQLNEKFRPPFRLEVDEDWFAVTRGKARRLDGEPGVSIARYQVIGDEMTRMQPLALTPEDFLDEWVQLDWSEAAHASSQIPDLQVWHSKLRALAYDSVEFEFVQACREQGSADKTWLAGLWVDRKLNPTIENERLYIVVSDKHHAFFVDSVSTTHPPGCPGRARPRLTNWELPQW